MIPCLEPINQQQAYDMTRAAFDLSEELRVPVMLRIVTRMAHCRAVVSPSAARQQNPLNKASKKTGWMLLPATARANYKALLSKQDKMRALSESSIYNPFTPGDADYAVITTGLGGNYFDEIKNEISPKPAHMHISQYPLPPKKIADLAAQYKTLIFIEEGFPFAERSVRGLIGTTVEIKGENFRPSAF